MSTADRIASLLVRTRDAAADAHRLTEEWMKPILWAASCSIVP